MPPFDSNCHGHRLGGAGSKEPGHEIRTFDDFPWVNGGRGAALATGHAAHLLGRYSLVKQPAREGDQKGARYQNKSGQSRRYSFLHNSTTEPAAVFGAADGGVLPLNPQLVGMGVDGAVAGRKNCARSSALCVARRRPHRSPPASLPALWARPLAALVPPPRMLAVWRASAHGESAASGRTHNPRPWPRRLRRGPGNPPSQR